MIQYESINQYVFITYNIIYSLIFLLVRFAYNICMHWNGDELPSLLCWKSYYYHKVTSMAIRMCIFLICVIPVSIEEAILLMQNMIWNQCNYACICTNERKRENVRGGQTQTKRTEVEQNTNDKVLIKHLLNDFMVVNRLELQF